jgi:hypothetical protein
VNISLRTTNGVIADGPVLRALRAHRGDYVLIRRAVGGFIEMQGVKIIHAVDAGFRGLEVTVEGLVPGTECQETARRVMPAADLAVPRAWLAA